MTSEPDGLCISLAANAYDFIAVELNADQSGKRIASPVHL
jgi:hypothetical protein